jgi:hypothetical protein
MHFRCPWPAGMRPKSRLQTSECLEKGSSAVRKLTGRLAASASDMKTFESQQLVHSTPHSEVAKSLTAQAVRVADLCCTSFAHG